MATIHKFYSVAFKESFVLERVSNAIGAQTGLMDPRDTVFKELSDKSRVYGFNFGALGFWNMDPDKRQNLLTTVIKATAISPTELKVTEDFIVEEDPSQNPKVEFSKFVIDELTPPRAELIAYTVAQSAAMEYYEELVGGIWDEINLLASMLRKTGKSRYWPKRLYREIGKVVSIRNNVIGVLHLLDHPALIWEDNLMDSLYSDLRSVFDLEHRHIAIQAKLENIQDTLEILIDTARDSRLFFVEVAILVLIAVEIVLAVLPKFFPN